MIICSLLVVSIAVQSSTFVFNLQKVVKKVPKPSIVYATCPPPDLLYPCECFDDSSILCSDSPNGTLITSNLLSSKFKAINKHINQDMGHSLTFHSIMIPETSSLGYISENVFSNISFQRIKFETNQALSINGFHKNAFLSSKHTLKDLTFVGPFLTNYSVPVKNIQMTGNTLFESIQDLKILSSFTVSYSHEVSSIPITSFLKIPTSLKQINLNDNKIRSIDRLNQWVTRESNLSEINLSFNRITRINLSSFRINGSNVTSCLPLKVDLWFNDLTESSFIAINETSDKRKRKSAFMIRPVLLELNFNHLKTIPESSFMPFMMDNIKNVAVFRGNPIECDCRLNWLLHNKKLLQHRMKEIICDSNGGIIKSLFNMSLLELEERCSNFSNRKPFQRNFFPINLIYSRRSDSKTSLKNKPQTINNKTTLNNNWTALLDLNITSGNTRRGRSNSSHSNAIIKELLIIIVCISCQFSRVIFASSYAPFKGK